MNYKPAIAALEKLILEGKYKNVQSKQTLSSNTESKELFEKVLIIIEAEIIQKLIM